MEDATRHLSGLRGRDVFTTNGTRVGTVSDGLIDFNSGTLAHVVVESLNNSLFEQFASGYQGLKIPYRWVRAVGDVVIVVDALERVSEDQELDASSF